MLLQLSLRLLENPNCFFLVHPCRLPSPCHLFPRIGKIRIEGLKVILVLLLNLFGPVQVRIPLPRGIANAHVHLVCQTFGQSSLMDTRESLRQASASGSGSRRRDDGGFDLHRQSREGRGKLYRGFGSLPWSFVLFVD